MSKKLLGGSGAAIAVVGFAVVLFMSCRWRTAAGTAAQDKLLVPLCNFRQSIQMRLGMKPMGNMGTTGQMMQGAIMTDRLHRIQALKKMQAAGMMPMSPAPPAAKSMLGYTLSRVAGAHDDDLL